MEHWYSFIYLYLVGGILFSLALYLGIRKGVLKLNRSQDRRMMYCIVGAFLFYFIFQGLWNIWAIKSSLY